MSLDTALLNDTMMTKCTRARCPAKFAADRHLCHTTHTSYSAGDYFEQRKSTVCAKWVDSPLLPHTMKDHLNATWAFLNLRWKVAYKPPTGGMAPPWCGPTLSLGICLCPPGQGTTPIPQAKRSPARRLLTHSSSSRNSPLPPRAGSPPTHVDTPSWPRVATLHLLFHQ